ncbi:MAG: hypothetical protein JWM14_2632 [Chitinophagaceae bacterium]|nr:hypothetical protein [Chitinophagaceae bacterium]
MKKLTKISLLIVMMLSVSQLAMADQGETCKCSNSQEIASQLSVKMDKVSTRVAIPNGTVILKYSIDNMNRIHLLDVQTNDAALKQIVLENLEGLVIKVKGEKCAEGIVRMKFVESSNDEINTQMF